MFKRYELKLNGHLPYLAAEAEKLSRTTLVELLKEAGFSGKANQWKPDATMPAHVEPLLAEMTFTSQFQAVRELHEAIHGGGESPALLGGLVRGYANLALLTEYLWHPEHKVFKARALLYARRMVARDEHSAQARWHRAYALAVIGLHKDALDDLDAAEKEAKAAGASAAAQPAWAPLVRAYCHYDIDRLAAEGPTSAQGQLAGLLAFCSAELAHHPKVATAKAAELLPWMPECYRLYYVQCLPENPEFLGDVQQGADTAAKVFGERLYGRLLAMPGLPEGAAAIAKQRPAAKGLLDKLLGDSKPESPEEEFDARGQLMAALLAAGQPAGKASAEKSGDKNSDKIAAVAAAGGEGPAPRGEPSWHVLARLIRDVSFLQIWCQVRHSESVGGSTDELLTQVAPVLADHPYRGLIASQASDSEQRREALEELAKVDMRTEGLEARAEPVMNALSQFGRGAWERQSFVQFFQADQVANDLIFVIQSYDNDRLQAAHRLLVMSPDSPYAKAALIKYDWHNVRQYAAAWEKGAARQPAVLAALGKRHLEDGQLAAAERCLKAALSLAPEEPTYSQLALVYEKLGQEDKWLATLEECLKRCGGGLDNPRVRQTIAMHLMEHKQFEKAEPYAEEAAKSGAGWAILTAGACQEGLQNWDAAEEHFRNAATTYTDGRVTWYCFCRRTGHGDLDAARQTAREFVENFDPTTPDQSAARGYSDYAGLYFTLEQQYDEALDHFEGKFAKTNNPFAGLCAALLADRLKDAKKRDAALQQIKAKGAGYMREATGKPRSELIALADLIAQDLAHGGKGEIDLKAADKICAGAIDGAGESEFQRLPRRLPRSARQERQRHPLLEALHGLYQGHVRVESHLGRRRTDRPRPQTRGRRAEENQTTLRPPRPEARRWNRTCTTGWPCSFRKPLGSRRRLPARVTGPYPRLGRLGPIVVPQCLRTATSPC